MAWTNADLESCENAIRAIATGAISYTINGRTVTKANLADLKAWRVEIMREIGLAPRVLAGRLREA
jgi:hypothetical protein